MTNEIREKVFLKEGVQTVKELEAVLPSSWKCHYRTRKDAIGSVICVARVGHGVVEEELRQELYQALGDADFEWEEKKIEAISREKQRATDAKIRKAIRNKKNGKATNGGNTE